LAPSRVEQIVTSIGCDFGANGKAVLSSFGTPERVWWANDRVICCRYRLPIGTEGLEAVIDVHAFASNRAFVEVVVENGKIDANSSNPTAPSVKSYAGATVSVNGVPVVTVSSPTTSTPLGGRLGGNWGENGHAAFRAWYCSAWIGGDPGIDVTHDTASMRAHPWFWRPAIEMTTDFQSRYSQAYDVYSPWRACRLRVPGLGGGGDDEQIALFTQDQADYFLSGSKYAARACLATSTAQLLFTWQWRHSGGGEFNGQPPARSQFSDKGGINAGGGVNGSWPVGSQNEPYYGGSQNDASHVPAGPLVAFLCRPSPMFIEMAQKNVAWLHTNFSNIAGFHEFDQIRSRAWRTRNYAIALFLTPDVELKRKEQYRDLLGNYATQMKRFFSKPWNSLGAIWYYGPDDILDRGGNGAVYRMPAFMHWFCVMTWLAIDRVKILRGSNQDAWTTMAMKMGELPVRYVNEAQGGEWRIQYIDIRLGTQGVNSINMGAGNWGAMTRSDFAGTLPPNSGTWLWCDQGGVNYSSLTYNPSYNYADQFVHALSACVESGVPGAAAAWDRVYTNGGISNWAAWVRTVHSQSPRYNRFPRNR
jgi:hypothetical protein